MDIAPKLDRLTDAGSFHGSRGARLLFVAVVVVFGAIRFVALFNDLWLDEIWSVTAVNEYSSAAQIFSVFRLDNNHPLNSLWIYAMGPTDSDWLYRVLSFASGIGALWLAGSIASLLFRRMHPTAGPAQASAARVITATLFGGSYLLTLYSSEARGYAPALVFSLLAFFLLLRRHAHGWSPWAIAYWGACFLAMLAHPLGTKIVIAGLAWSLVMLGRERPPVNTWVATLLSWHVVPAASATLYYFSFVRKLLVIGGPETRLVGILGEFAAYTLGVPDSWAVFAALPLLVFIVVFGLFKVGRRDRATAGFFLVLFLISLGAPLASRFHLLYPRYFIIEAACALLLLGYLLALLWSRGKWPQAAVVVLVILSLLGNAIPVARLVRYGRGEYRQALRYMTERTTGPVVLISSDEDLRNSTVLAYYAKREVVGKVAQYLPAGSASSESPQWVLLHNTDADVAEAPPARLPDRRGNIYGFEKQFRHAPLSGWNWFLFRRLDREP